MPPRKYRLYFLLFCGTMLYFLANVQRVAIPGTVFNLLQERLQVSAPWITGLGSAFMYVYALNQLAVGLLVERYGGARVIVFGAAAFCAGSLLFPFSGSLPMLYFSRALTGLGASTLYLSLVQETIRMFRNGYAVLLSIIIMIGYAGGIAANAPFALGVERFGFDAVLYAAGGLALLFYLLFLLTRATLKPVPVRKVPLDFRCFAEVLKVRHNRDLFVFSGINFGLYYVLQTVIGKKFLEDWCGMASGSAAWVLSAMGTLSAVSGFLIAVLSRMTGNRRRIFCRIAGCVCIAAFLILTLLLLAGIRTQWIAAVFCMFAMTASMSTVTIPLLRETNLPELSGPAICFMNFSFYLAVAFFGNLTGFLMNAFPPEVRNGAFVYGRASWLTVFAVLAAFALPVFRCAMRMRETRGVMSAESGRCRGGSACTE